MKWELGALKMLAKNPTVPGVALQDAIKEIERLNKKVDHLNADIVALRGLEDGSWYRCSGCDELYPKPVYSIVTTGDYASRFCRDCSKDGER